MPDLALAAQIIPGATDDTLHRRNSDGEIVRVKASDKLKGAPFGGAGISDEELKQETYQLTSMTYDADQVLTGGTVLWPDGSGGTFTTVEIDSTHLMINKYTVTHTVSSKTLTQPTITRDTDGNPTVIPAKTVT